MKKRVRLEGGVLQTIQGKIDSGRSLTAVQASVNVEEPIMLRALQADNSNRRKPRKFNSLRFLQKDDFRRLIGQNHLSPDRAAKVYGISPNDQDYQEWLQKEELLPQENVEVLANADLKRLLQRGIDGLSPDARSRLDSWLLPRSERDAMGTLVVHVLHQTQPVWSDQLKAVEIDHIAGAFFRKAVSFRDKRAALVLCFQACTETKTNGSASLMGRRYKAAFTKIRSLGVPPDAVVKLLEWMHGSSLSAEDKKLVR